MQEQIQNTIDQVEVEYGIKILYACESGSRAWGFPSTDSDYDVRFIYLHPLDWYLSIAERRDVIARDFENDLDLSGWDLRKTLRLLRKSNAVVWEWLQSPIVYRQQEGFCAELLFVARRFFSPKSVCYHYLALAKRSAEDLLLPEKRKLKKYFYVLRPLLAAKWVATKHDIAPMEIGGLLEQEQDGQIVLAVNELIKRKREVGESEQFAEHPLLDDYIKEGLAQCQHAAENLPGADGDAAELDIFFRKVVRADA